MIRVNLIREHSSSNPLVAGSCSTRAVRQLREAAFLVCKSLQPVRKSAAPADETKAATSLQRPIRTGILSTSSHVSQLKDSSPLRSIREITPSPVAFVDAEALVRELILLMFRGQRQSEAVLAYLAAAEAHEPDVWLRDDLRLSWLTVLRAAEGHPDPWRYSFWAMFGRVPEKLIPEFCARAARHAAMEPGAAAPGVQAPALPSQETHGLVRESADERPTGGLCGKQGEGMVNDGGRILQHVEESSPTGRGAGQRRGLRGAEKSAPINIPSPNFSPAGGKKEPASERPPALAIPGAGIPKKGAA